MTSNKTDYKTFRMTLATQLIGQYNSRQRYALPTPVYEIASCSSTRPGKKRSTSEGNGHYPVKSKKLKCWYCVNVDGVRHESRISCKECNVALCIDTHDDSLSCFEKYHTK